MTRRQCGVVTGVVASLAIAASAHAATYDIVPIGPPISASGVSSPTAINASGQVLGWVEQASDPSQTAWLYDPTTATYTSIGLTDADHTTSAGLRWSNPWLLTDSGAAVGMASRYGSNGVDDGADAWRYDPSTGATGVIGPTDAAHTNNGVRQAAPLAVTASGAVVGTSLRADSGASQSYDAWIYSPASNATQVIGLTDAAHTPVGGVPDNRVIAVNPAGVVIGTASRAEGPSHTDAWVYNPATGTYRTTGLLDADHNENSGYGVFQRPVAINALGQVIGTSVRSTGETDAWFDANNGQPARQIGLIDADHSTSVYPVADNEPKLIDRAGTVVVGTADRGTSSDYNLLGHDAWAYSPSTDQTKLIGLTDAAHTGYEGKRDDTPVLMNASGLTIGVSDRYADGTLYASSYDLWAYDPGTGLTTAIDMDLLGGATRSLALGDDGRLVGAYVDGTGFGDQDTYGLFTWTSADGVQLIDLPAGYYVSDGDQIVMNGADQFAVRWTCPRTGTRPPPPRSCSRPCRSRRRLPYSGWALPGPACGVGRHAGLAEPRPDRRGLAGGPDLLGRKKRLWTMSTGRP